MAGRLWRWAISKSVGSCAGVILTAPGAELRIDRVVADDHADPIDVRNPHVFADQVRVARIVWMDRHADVAQDRLGSRGGDGNPLVRSASTTG